MTHKTKACQLVECLQIVLGEAKGTDKKNAGVCELVSAQETQLLLALGRSGALAMSAAADALKLSLSSLTGLVDKLEEKGYARRDRCKQDRRIVYVDLTEEGRKVYLAALEGHIQFAKRMLEALGEREQDQLIALFRKVADGIQEAKKAAAV